MNFIEIQDDLKNYSDEQLTTEMKSPSGQVPQYMVLSELTRRKRMRDEFQRRQSNPHSTVADDIMRETDPVGAGVPQGGIGDMARALAPRTDVMMNTAREPVGFADGGSTSTASDGGVKAAKKKSIRSQLDAMAPVHVGSPYGGDSHHVVYPTPDLSMFPGLSYVPGPNLHSVGGLGTPGYGMSPYGGSITTPEKNQGSPYFANLPAVQYDPKNSSTQTQALLNFTSPQNMSDTSHPWNPANTNPTPEDYTSNLTSGPVSLTQPTTVTNPTGLEYGEVSPKDSLAELFPEVAAAKVSEVSKTPVPITSYSTVLPKGPTVAEDVIDERPVVRLADGGPIVRGGVVQDNAFKVMAERMGMTPEEYWDSLQPEAQDTYLRRDERDRMMSFDPVGSGAGYASQPYFPMDSMSPPSAGGIGNLNIPGGPTENVRTGFFMDKGAYDNDISWPRGHDISPFNTRAFNDPTITSFPDLNPQQAVDKYTPFAWIDDAKARIASGDVSENEARGLEARIAAAEGLRGAGGYMMDRFGNTVQYGDDAVGDAVALFNRGVATPAMNAVGGVTSMFSPELGGAILNFSDSFSEGTDRLAEEGFIPGQPEAVAAHSKAVAESSTEKPEPSVEGFFLGNDGMAAAEAADNPFTGPNIPASVGEQTDEPLKEEVAAERVVSGGGTGAGTGAGTGGGGGGNSRSSSMSASITATPMMDEYDRLRERQKWLSLAHFGLALMADESPRLAQAAGNAGVSALEGYAQGISALDKEERALRLSMMQAAAARRGGGGGGVRGRGASSSVKSGFPDPFSTDWKRANDVADRHEDNGRSLQLQAAEYSIAAQEAAIAGDMETSQIYKNEAASLMAGAEDSYQMASEIRYRAGDVRPMRLPEPEQKSTMGYQVAEGSF